MSKWIEFVKEYAKKHNIKYAQALKDCKEEYHKAHPKENIKFKITEKGTGGKARVKDIKKLKEIKSLLTPVLDTENRGFKVAPITTGERPNNAERRENPRDRTRGIGVKKNKSKVMKGGRLTITLNSTPQQVYDFYQDLIERWNNSNKSQQARTDILRRYDRDVFVFANDQFIHDDWAEAIWTDMRDWLAELETPDGDMGDHHIGTIESFKPDDYSLQSGHTSESDYEEGGDISSFAFSKTNDILNKILKQITDLNSKHTQGGKGILDSIKKGVEKVKEFGHSVIHGRKGLNPKVQKILKEYGDQVIRSMKIDRTPVPSVLTSALSVLSGGHFGKELQNAPYDKLFHLRLDITTDKGVVSLEKNEVINMDKNPKQVKGSEQKPVPNIPAGLTINQLIEKAQHQLGNSFLPYSAKDNNCQDFIMGVLKGSHIGNNDDFNFIKQNTDKLFGNTDWLRKISNTITDIGARADVVRHGGKIKGKGGGASKYVIGENTYHNTTEEASEADERRREERERKLKRRQERERLERERLRLEQERLQEERERRNMAMEDTLYPTEEIMNPIHTTATGIDFSKIKTGTFTRHLNTFNKKHKCNMTLDEFAHLIMNHPDKFSKLMRKKASFYLNVLEHHKK